MSEINDETATWAARLDIFRRSVDLRLDGEGRWYHDGAPFEHARLIELFDRGIDVHPDSGAPILRVGGKWCYVQADDVPFLVRALRHAGDELVARINTGEQVSLATDALSTSGDHVYARLDERRTARLDRATHNGLAALLDEGEDGRPVVAGRWAITTGS